MDYQQTHQCRWTSLARRITPRVALRRALVSPPSKNGQPYAYFGVFDGHGGFATSQWLTDNLQGYILEAWDKVPAESALKRAYIAADKQLLAPKGFLGMSERGVGGSKCGSTAATAIIYKDNKGE
eukprot:2687453-Pyramimonas_sp.AAC.2